MVRKSLSHRLGWERASLPTRQMQLKKHLGGPDGQLQTELDNAPPWLK